MCEKVYAWIWPVLEITSLKLLLAGAAEATKMWMCSLSNKSNFFETKLGLYQRRKLKSGCASAQPAHQLPPTLGEYPRTGGRVWSAHGAIFKKQNLVCTQVPNMQTQILHVTNITKGLK